MCLGQAPARQAAIYAGIPTLFLVQRLTKSVPGMKSIMLAAQTIELGNADVVVAGGMENMSAIIHYYHARKATKFGAAIMEDGMQKDGLVDVYNQVAMGVCADTCAKEHHFQRRPVMLTQFNRISEQLAPGVLGNFQKKLNPVEIPQRRGEPILFTEDEEYKNVKIEKIPALRPAFTKDGTVTAANASN